MRKTKIVATIGPASGTPEMLVRMIAAGMDVARLNFSHGTRETHAETVERIRTAANRADRRIAILQDLPGPKLRIGELLDGLAELRAGDKLTLLCGTNQPGTAEQMSVSWAGLPDAVEKDAEIYLADGTVHLRVVEARPGAGEVETKVEVGGAVSSRQGINIPGSVTGLPSVPEEDLESIKFGESLGVDLIALSFIRNAKDVKEVREHTRTPLVAKIEKPQALIAAEEIVRASDCVMVARGDLGIELPIEEVPLAQKQILKLAGQFARPSITATQMLNSMVVSPRPTRAEATDVANAILDGTDAVMLSQETAVGQYPIEAVQMMAAIATHAERAIPYEEWNEHRVHRDSRDPAYTIAHTAATAVRQLDLAALVIPTLSGRSARLVSAHRPSVPVLALSPTIETVRRCSLMWGVRAAKIRYHHVTEELIADSAKRIVALGWVQPGQRVGITAGLPSGKPGTTSLFQVQEV